MIMLDTLSACKEMSSPKQYFLFPTCSRIYEILPQRIQQWQQSPCIAEEHGKKQLERIRRDQQNARLRLTDMERRFHELEGIIAKAKQQAVQQDEEVLSFSSKPNSRMFAADFKDGKT
ncbi:CXXC-type zinc finger protein 1 [Xenoophorus captivus]|uniref:CXXC-type zinc finger protein 1 n=1 Tax=Xenoophorus captivus TaxID=1517983 RepID=A0ABV0R1H9_9TELE